MLRTSTKNFLSNPQSENINLMVCSGNICRSPQAEYILKEKLSQDRFGADSTGTEGYHPSHSPDQRGIDIRHQKARKFYPDDFGLFDKIFVMDHSNLGKVKKMALTLDHKKKVTLLLENDDVPDPYYGNEDGFKNVFELIDKTCHKLSDEQQKLQS